jgi:hypothetical protein
MQKPMSSAFLTQIELSAQIPLPKRPKAVLLVKYTPVSPNCPKIAKWMGRIGASCNSPLQYAPCKCAPHNCPCSWPLANVPPPCAPATRPCKYAPPFAPAARPCQCAPEMRPYKGAPPSCLCSSPLQMRLPFAPAESRCTRALHASQKPPLQMRARRHKHAAPASCAPPSYPCLPPPAAAPPFAPAARLCRCALRLCRCALVCPCISRLQMRRTPAPAIRPYNCAHHLTLRLSTCSVPPFAFCAGPLQMRPPFANSADVTTYLIRVR